MQQIQHMRFGCYALIQSQFHSSNDDLFVVMEDESEDIGHLAITARAAQHLVLQSSKGQRQFQERCAIAQGSGFALDDGKVMPPVIDCPG
ncbi:TnpA8 (fragment) [Agrobacterium fabacearum TT111]